MKHRCKKLELQDSGGTNVYVILYITTYILFTVYY